MNNNPRPSAAPPGAAGARAHFTQAVNILSHTPAPVKRTFGGSARDVEAISARLVRALQHGTAHGSPLSVIDQAASELMQKCLEIQQLTIKARADGAK